MAWRMLSSSVVVGQQSSWSVVRRRCPVVLSVVLSSSCHPPLPSPWKVQAGFFRFLTSGAWAGSWAVPWSRSCGPMWLRRDGTTRGERGCQGGGRGGPGGGKGPWNSPGGFFWGGKVLGIWAVRMVGRGERECSHACAPRTSIKYEVMYWGFK